MWKKDWREEVWSQLNQTFDLIIIGGGITGAGIFSEAVKRGFKTLLVEANDFGSGTSSRSSKLVHGGFRYLKNGQIKITYDSVREREKLLREERGLINELSFLIARYEGDRLPMWALGLGLTVYDLIAFRWGHKYYGPERILDLCPYLNPQALHGGYRYFDALTDDARLVLKTIKSGVAAGGLALNYCPVEKILRTTNAQIAGVLVKDMGQGSQHHIQEVHSQAVINATGVWTEVVSELDPNSQNGRIKLRRLQGSHLIFPSDKLPLTRAISIWHPRDKRPVFAFPWENVTVVGTTDIDTETIIETDPCISPEEFDYLMEFIHFSFPNLKLTPQDVQSTYSGYRSVVDTGKSDPSSESREHIFMYDKGLLTVAGGKLTTFRLVANQALNMIERNISKISREINLQHNIDKPSPKLFIKTPLQSRQGIKLIGRYGHEVFSMLDEISLEEFDQIEGSLSLWAEIRWSVRSEGIVHLDDLLLRRVRLGNVLPYGGVNNMHRIKKIILEELKWSDNVWSFELSRYEHLLKQAYSVRL